MQAFVYICDDKPENTIAVGASEACLVINVLISDDLFHLVDTSVTLVTHRSSTRTLSTVKHTYTVNNNHKLQIS